MFFLVEQAFVGREEIRAPLKTPAWESMTQKARKKKSEYSGPAERGWSFWLLGQMPYH